MSLRSINTILERTRISNWTENANIDAISKCVLIGYDKLPVRSDRILAVGTSVEGREMLSRKLTALKKPMEVILTDNPRMLGMKYFGLDTKREPDAPFAVIVGQLLKGTINNKPVFYWYGTTPPLGLEDPFKVVEGLSRKYGSKLIISNLGKGRVDEIAKSLFS